MPLSNIVESGIKYHRPNQIKYNIYIWTSLVMFVQKCTIQSGILSWLGNPALT
jgi:hypothetical protein